MAPTRRTPIQVHRPAPQPYQDRLGHMGQNACVRLLCVGPLTTTHTWPVTMQENLQVLDEADQHDHSGARESHEEEGFKHAHRDYKQSRHADKGKGCGRKDFGQDL
jgi:hypothetical protein